MSTQPKPDETLARTLAALRSAAPPEGMESRITQRLAEHRVPHSCASRPGSPASGLYSLGWFASARMGGFITSMAPQSAWLRGAITGAAAASLAFGAVLFASHVPQLRAPQQTAKTAPLISAPNTVEATPVRMNTNAAACTNGAPHPSSAWMGGAVTTVRSTHLIPASFAPSKPAPPAPLTPQERALIQLARTATPAELAALNRSSVGTQSDAEREAAFRKFFAPSPEVLAIDKAQGVPTDADQTKTPQPEVPPQPEVQN